MNELDLIELGDEAELGLRNENALTTYIRYATVAMRATLAGGCEF